MTEEELELVERRDTTYLQTFWNDNLANEDEAEMMIYESDSKYVRGWSDRRTFVIKNSSEKSLTNNCSLQ